MDPHRDPDCPFCAIVAGDQPARIVEETDDTVAFLDIEPLAAGHTLVVPRAHRERLEDLTDDEAAALGQAIPRVAGAAAEGVEAAATTVGFNNGRAAGQVVPHVHCHVVPRTREDHGGNLHSIFDRSASMSSGTLDEVAAAIRSALTE